MATILLTSDEMIMFKDNGMFRDYYEAAYDVVKNMTLEEIIAQLLLVRYPDNDGDKILEKYQFGGYVFFSKDFNYKSKLDIFNMINKLQRVAKIPILTAVDEEGGNVVRISNNSNLASSPFDSPSNLYKKGGFSLIRSDTIRKSNLLSELGFNLNLAPVVDVSSNPNSYIYDRTLKEDVFLTSLYAKVVIEASHGTLVSYTLKHFPGYSNNNDTHTDSTIDNRSYDEISKDILPFEAGISSLAEAILVNHNIIKEIDNNNPASLSFSIHKMLRDKLNFSGIIITDDISMSAVSNIKDVAALAVLAGNDLIISTNYQEDIKNIKDYIKRGILSYDIIEEHAIRVIAWKYYKGLL